MARAVGDGEAGRGGGHGDKTLCVVPPQLSSSYSLLIFSYEGGPLHYVQPTLKAQNLRMYRHKSQ